MKGDEEKCLAAGCSGFLSKPINIDKLIESISITVHGNTQNIVQLDPVTEPEPTAQDGAETEGRTETATETEITEGSARKRHTGPIRSKLPMDDPEFREIVEEFVPHLKDKLVSMKQVLEEGDFNVLAENAHWLKGAGGTVGFDEFNEPARELETYVKKGQIDLASQVLEEIVDLANSIDLSPCDLENNLN